MANKIEIDVVAKDLASAALDIVKEKLTSMGGKFGMVGAAALTMGAAIVTGLAKAVNMAQEYDQKVYDMMLTTRGTAEETSKLIQVIDDTGVSYETLKTAMKMAVKNGIQPNIESMADLADQYKALKDPVKQGQLLLDNFGKSGLEMARVMEMGGDALRKMSGEMSGGLILTQANIDASEEYRKNLDNLQDTVDGVAVSIGNELIPELNNVLVVIKDTANELQNEANWFERLTVTTLLAKNAAELHRAEEVAATDAVAAHGDALDGLIVSIDGATMSLEEQTAASKATTETNRGLMSLAKTIQTEMDNYKTSVSELSTEQYNLTQKLIALEAAGMKGTQTWRDTTQALWENKNEMTALGTEHELQMKKIATDLYIAKLMAGEFTDQEYKMAMQALISSGQIDQATADMVLGFEDAANAALRAKDSVVLLGGKAKEVATDYFMNFIATLTINAKRVDYGSEPPDVAVPPGAPDLPNGDMQATGTGGNFLTVPAGYPNDGYPVWMTSGEQYAVIPRNGNNTNNGGGAMGGMVVNLTYAPAFSTASQSEFVSSITPMLDAWYRKAKRA